MQLKPFCLDVLKLGGAYIAFCIGSGYATGQEILQFFTAFGKKGVFGALFSMLLFMWLGITLMKDGRKLSFADDRSVFCYYCGNVAGKAYDFFFTCFLFGCYTIMIGGAGESAAAYFGIPAHIGRLAMSGVCLFTIFLGLQKLVEIIGIIGPVIIVFSILIGGGSLLCGAVPFSESEALLSLLPRSCSNWAFSGILYAGYMAVICIPFLFHLASSAKSDRSAVWGGAVGGFFLVLAILVMHLALLAHLPQVYDHPIPTLLLAANLSPLLAGAYTAVILLGIYSSAVPMLWLLCKKAGPDGSARSVLLCLLIVIAALWLSTLPFRTLVGTIYPYTGYIGIALMLCVFLRHFFPSS